MPGRPGSRTSRKKTQPKKGAKPVGDVGLEPPATEEQIKQLGDARRRQRGRGKKRKLREGEEVKKGSCAKGTEASSKNRGKAIDI